MFRAREERVRACNKDAGLFQVERGKTSAFLCTLSSLATGLLNTPIQCTSSATGPNIWPTLWLLQAAARLKNNNN